MAPELLALCAAFSYAFGGIAIKFATQPGGILTGYVLSLATSMAVVVVAAWVLVDDWALPLAATALFAGAGVLGPGLGRLLSMRAVRDAGATVAVPVQSSINPLVASAAGIVLFGEAAEPARLAALALVVAGIWACARGGSANRVPGHGLDASGSLPVNRLVLAWPLAVGVVRATALAVQKSGLVLHDEPALGALVGLGVALGIWGTVVAARPPARQRARMDRGALGWFCATGLLSAVGMVFTLSALGAGDLVVVAPIISSQPVMVILLSALLLRDLERVRLGTALGALSTVGGIVYLSVA